MKKSLISAEHEGRSRKRSLMMIVGERLAKQIFIILIVQGHEIFPVVNIQLIGLLEVFFVQHKHKLLMDHLWFVDSSCKLRQKT